MVVLHNYDVINGDGGVGVAVVVDMVLWRWCCIIMTSSMHKLGIKTSAELSIPSTILIP